MKRSVRETRQPWPSLYPSSSCAASRRGQHATDGDDEQWQRRGHDEHRQVLVARAPRPRWRSRTTAPRRPGCRRRGSARADRDRRRSGRPSARTVTRSPPSTSEHAGHQDGRSHARSRRGRRSRAGSRPVRCRAGGSAACAPLVGGAQEDRSTDRRRRRPGGRGRRRRGRIRPGRHAGRTISAASTRMAAAVATPTAHQVPAPVSEGGPETTPRSAQPETSRSVASEADPAQGAHEQRAQVPTRSRRWVRTWNPVRRATRASAASSSCSTAADTSKSVTSPQDEQIRWWWWCVRSSASS